MATIFSLPRDIVGALMISPFCGLRRTCKWFQDYCGGVFTINRRHDRVKISSLWYKYIIPPPSIDRFYIWDGVRYDQIPIFHIFQPLCNYMLVPLSGEHTECHAIFCSDDELRHFAPLIDCAVYKLWSVIDRKHEIFDTRIMSPYHNRIETKMLGGAIVISMGVLDNIMSKRYVQHLDIMELPATIRGSCGRKCVYVEIAQ